MAESAIQRAARALDLVPYVSENPGISIKELALRFHVSEKQIIKDLELIFLCGLPGYTPYELIDLTFEDGLVTIIEPQLLDKPRQFSETEAVIINLGLNLLKNSSSNPDQHKIIDRLLAKLSTKFRAVNQTTFAEIPKPANYEDISQAINSNSHIQFRYRSLSHDEVTSRQVKPEKILLKNDKYYLIAYDQVLESERTFRLDLISDIQVVTNIDHSTEVSKPDNELIKFELITNDRIFSEKYRELFSQIDQSGEDFHIYGEIANREWMLRWILSNSPAVKLISPQDVRDVVTGRAKAALDLY